MPTRPQGFKLTRGEALVLEQVIELTKIDTWFSLIEPQENLYFVYDLEEHYIVDFVEAINLVDDGIDWEIVKQELSSEEFVIFNNLINRIIYL